MHFFGTIGVMMFFIGILMAGNLGLEKYLALANGYAAPLVANSPFFYFALTLMIIGSQMFLAGFLGELISRSSADRNHYLIEKRI